MIQKFICQLLFSFLWCPIIFGTAANQNEKAHFLFIGNPGVGKSTLLNMLVDENTFKSGLSVGAGLTKYLQCCEHEGKVYIDTPGLADLARKEAAAKEIENALKMGGKYHLFFVFNLNELRIMEQDLVTLELVLDAIDFPDKKFNIIINKLDAEEREALQNPATMAEFLYLLRKQKYNTETIWFIDKDCDLRRKTKTHLSLDDNTRHFIYNLSKSMSINDDQVKPIAWNKYEELRKATTKKIANLEDKIRNNDEEIKRLKQDLIDAKNALPKNSEPPTAVREEEPVFQFPKLGLWDSIGIVVFSLLQGR